MKRLFRLLLTCLLVLALIPTEASAATSGTISENISWTLSDDGTLTVFGNGEIGDYPAGSSPWHSYRSTINTVVIDQGITRVGHAAFYAFKNLTQVSLPGTLETIGIQAFQQTGLQRVVIPEGVKIIEQHAFLSCTDLSEVIFPTTLEQINYGAFNSCGLLEVVLTDGTKTIGDSSFSSCPSLNSVVLPDTVEVISLRAFENCPRLRSVVIPEGVTTIEAEAFENCTSLSGISLPSTLTILEGGAFRNTGLTEIIIPEGITSLRNHTFAYCDNLKQIKFLGDIPTLMASDAFTDVTAIAYYPANNPSWTEDDLQDYGGTITWVPYGSTEGDGEDGEDEKDPESAIRDQNWFVDMANRIEENYLWATATFIRLRDLFT